MKINIIKTELIEKFMIKEGWSKSKFCERCKINLGVLNKILSNKLNFRIMALFRIAKVMGVEVCELFNE